MKADKPSREHLLTSYRSSGQGGGEGSRQIRREMARQKDVVVPLANDEAGIEISDAGRPVHPPPLRFGFPLARPRLVLRLLQRAGFLVCHSLFEGPDPDLR